MEVSGEGGVVADEATWGRPRCLGEAPAVCLLVGRGTKAEGDRMIERPGATKVMELVEAGRRGRQDGVCAHSVRGECWAANRALCPGWRARRGPSSQGLGLVGFDV